MGWRTGGAGMGIGKRRNMLSLPRSLCCFWLTLCCRNNISPTLSEIGMMALHLGRFPPPPGWSRRQEVVCSSGVRGRGVGKRRNRLSPRRSLCCYVLTLCCQINIPPTLLEIGMMALHSGRSRGQSGGGKRMDGVEVVQGWVGDGTRKNR